MGYLKSITRLSQQDNIGGLQQIKVCSKSSVLSIPDAIDSVIYGDIELKPGEAFVTWDVTLETARIQTQDQTSREGNSKRISLPFVVPKDRADLRTLFRMMERDEFIVIFQENGRQKLFGLLQAPILFSYAHDSGENIGDRNAYACRFFYEGPDNVNFYNGGIGSATPGPAPAIVRHNGIVIGSLQPGESFNITSDFGFTNFYTSS